MAALYSLVEAAAQLGTSRSALRHAIKAGVVEATATGSGNGTRYKLTQAQLEEAKALRCTYSGCNAAAPTQSRRCGKHSARGGLRPGEWSAGAAARHLGWAVPTITSKIINGTIPGRIVEHPSGPTYALADETVQELAKRRCSRDGCDELAGPTGRCAGHPVGLVERVCELEGCSEKFTVARSVVARGFGKYCSHRCNLEAQREAKPESYPNLGAIRDGIAEHRERIAAELTGALKEAGWLDPEATSRRLRGLGVLASVQTVVGTTGFYGRGLLDGRVHQVLGSPRLLFHDSTIVDFAKTYSVEGDGRREMYRNPRFRASWYRSRHGGERLFGRYAKEIAAAEGKKVGPKRQLSDDEVRQILALLKEGHKQRWVAKKVGVGRSQVYRLNRWLKTRHATPL